MTRIVAIPLLAIAISGAACHRSPAPSAAFVESLRCGMNRDEVTQLAREKGYDPSDATWLRRSAAAKKSKELTLVDLTFREGKLVAVRQGTYDPRTKQVVYTTRDLCGAR